MCIDVILKRAGTPIGPYDLQIAAIALAHQLIVVTHNTGEFQRVPGLKIDDWEICGTRNNLIPYRIFQERISLCRLQKRLLDVRNT